MERPKSAKHNIERFKKSFYNSYKRNLTTRNVSSNDSYANDENDNNEHDLVSPSELRIRKEQRKMASKSAYAGSTKLRPSSARHNLDKYRHDVMIENLKKQEVDNAQMQPQKKHRQNTNSFDETENYEHKLKNIENFESMDTNTNMNKNSLNDEALVDDNIDSLDGLLIREEEDDSSSDELDSHGSMNEMITHQQPAPHQPPSNQTKMYPNQKSHGNQQKQLSKQKLLERRGVPNNNQGKAHNKKFSHQLSNASIKTSQTYPTTHQNSHQQDQSNSILVAQKQKESSPINNNQMNIISFHQTGEDFDEDPGKAGIAYNNVPCTTNSSSSSSTSSQQLSTTLNGPKEDLLHLSNTCEEEIVVLETRSKAPINNLTDLVSQKLLNEWNRNDDEVELTIEKLNEFDTNNNNGYSDYRSHQKPPNGTTNFRRQHSRNSNQSQSKQTQQLILLNNTTGRTSRFSDQSSSTVNNFYAKNPNVNSMHNTNGQHQQRQSHALNAANLNNHNQQTLMTREKSCSSMDPWTRRNPTLVAQNVLMKHRSELEQMHNSRHANNTSRQSNNTSTMLTTTNKYLLPDNKYFKKNSSNY